MKTTRRLSLDFFNRSKQRPPTPPPKSPPLSPLSLTYQPQPSGSKFTEDEVSAVLSSETGTSYTASVAEPPPITSTWKKLRTTSSRLHKPRRASIPVFDVPDEVAPVSIPDPSPAPLGSISFSPAPHTPESFTEDDRLEVKSHENAVLVLLRDVAPEQSAKCAELLRTSLPQNRDEIRDIMPHNNGFVKTVIEAYNNHRGLIIRPDDVWLAILVQFSFFVNGNAEALRRDFVGHQGKSELIIFSEGNRYTADFALMAHQMTDLMHQQITDPELREWIMPNFTTTSLVDTTAYAMVMMATMKEYFSFKFVLRCGIPRVTLEGEKKDWESILIRLEKLKKYGIQTIAWYHLLRPVISRFVAAYDNPNSQENLDFWNKVAHRELGSGPQWLSGWITAFCVFDEKGQWQGNKLNEERIREHEPKKLLRPADPLQISASQFASVYTIRERSPHLVLDGFPFPTIDSQDIPCGYAHLDVKLDDNGELFDTMLIAGSIGSQICSAEKSELFRNGMRDTVRPVTAWWYLIKKESIDEDEEE
ncbi:hypothetical protein HYDPIDRAFT_118237 [Hydnomerulius pinastri MD-312]|uniref:Uncharacterized protein n=1 Tax=Hydnomerulius pinastri MD-312 TaxID=994086 RepID=A0A0C9W964_9AGAM|nr:hypothetical protein HYDPIDRAFT_118237 [Hydnomerulius pinastri MD-312]